MSRRSPVRGGGGGDGKPSNIYERPRGPRTGIGYPKAGVIEVRFVIPSKIAGSGEVLKLVFALILYSYFLDDSMNFLPQGGWC